MMPAALLTPAGMRVSPIDEAAPGEELRRLPADIVDLRIACAPDLGAAARKTTFAPEACKVTICDSTVGSAGL